MKYCSPEHQMDDWQIHKLLCKSFAVFQERPGKGYGRAISFPENSKKPRFTWIRIGHYENLMSDEDEPEDELLISRAEREAAQSVIAQNQIMPEEMGWDEARAKPSGYEEVEVESTDGRSNTSSASVHEDEEQLSDTLELRWHGTYSPDGSRPNQCVAFLTRIRPEIEFSGPLEVYGWSKAKGRCVDLDTGVLTLAINLLPYFYEECKRAYIERVGDEASSEMAPAKEQMGVTTLPKYVPKGIYVPL